MGWSHWYWDYHGAAEEYPPHVQIVIGPGFKHNVMLGYPTNPDAYLLNANFKAKKYLKTDRKSVV